MHKLTGWKRKIAISLLLLCFVFTAFSQSPDEASEKNKITLSANRIGLSASAIQDAIILKNYTDNSTGIQHLYLQQTYKGIPVYNSIKTLAFKGNQLLYSSGGFVLKIKENFVDEKPVVQPVEAIGKAALHLHLPFAKEGFSFVRNETINHTGKQFFSAQKIAKRNIETGLYWAPDSVGKWHLAWNVSIDVANSPDWWNVRVDATTGVVIGKNNFTVYERNNDENKPSNQFVAPPNGATNASYNVIPFPAENKNIANFSTVTNPWEAAGANNMATTLGWNYDGTTTYNISRGNNVFAYDDSANKNAPGSVATSVTALPDLSFSFAPDFTQNTSLSVNKSAAITNLFYWNNLMHDAMYQYGFDEPAGNFQTNNLGRGGLGNDLVLAESHDGSGLNNANFSTPDDGSSGRMQMYLWNAVKLPSFVVKIPSFIAGSDSCTESGFSPKNKLIAVGPVSGAIVLYNTDTLACSDTLATNLKGKIALIYRGNCTFTQKVKNAQNAGAIAVVMVNTQGTSLLTMGGTDTSIVIPAILISYTDGIAISNALKNGNAVTATLTGTPLLDGDFDDGIICHEYGHGVTHRLTGANASCMSNTERPDEGWSDY
ncbi:MAG: M36 family metallopeptidase, partial [Bacteroidota bacterium]|nr:M36 family metallopeptidase [Bacteroidota bacterium]